MDSRDERTLEERTFIVDFWAGIFAVLKWISLFQLISYLFRNRLCNQKRYIFVDAWVLGHLIASFLAVVLIRYIDFNPLRYFILVYAFLRIFEIIVYQVNVLLFDEHRAKAQNRSYSVRSYRRIVLLLLHNYFEIIFWFAAAYLVLAGEFGFENMNGPLVGVIYSSFVVMTNFGSPGIKAQTIIGLYVLWAQSITGLFMTLLSLARFIALLPAPGTLEKGERQD